ncbi:gamma-aminobutyraldehyde dehydrogenase [Arthrobacter sp. Hiyo4]|nr:gamma-aminobutyraldehyde dehydrogenase [Arthrobacter sp. Hiyo4]
MVQTLQNFINGEFVTPAGTDLLDIVNPTNGEVVAQSPVSIQADVDAAMTAAKDAFKSWKHVTPGQRQLMLLKLADAVEANSDELVEAQHRNTGQVRSLIASEEIAAGADQLRFFAGAARILEGKSAGEYFEGHTSYVRREPIGVVAQVAPWNYPFLMAIWKIGPALAAGNTVVLKPSDTTPESTLVLARLAGDILPAGVLNVVLGTGATGAMMVEHRVPGLVSITGSVRAGIAVASGAAKASSAPTWNLAARPRPSSSRTRTSRRARRPSPSSPSSTLARTAPPSRACWWRTQSTTTWWPPWWSTPRPYTPARRTTKRTTSAR